MTTSSPAIVSQRSQGRLLLVLGLLLAALGVVGYVVQLKAQRLSAPWYMPVAATVGLFLIVLSLWQRRTVWRVLSLLLVALTAAATWFFMLGLRLPAYAGPVAVGQPFPAFATSRADGTSFHQHDLKGEQSSVLVFFRGRW
jgi:hypothetical protein